MIKKLSSIFVLVLLLSFTAYSQHQQHPSGARLTLNSGSPLPVWNMQNLISANGVLTFDGGGTYALSMSQYGQVGIGINPWTLNNYGSNAAYSLYVKGGIRTDEVRVDLSSNWPDYVFESGYNLMPLTDLRKFIKQNKHLPGVKPADQVQEEGVDLAEMNVVLLRKVEELTLYVLELEERINSITQR